MVSVYVLSSCLLKPNTYWFTSESACVACFHLMVIKIPQLIQRRVVRNSINKMHIKLIVFIANEREVL